ncbi:hypothetical protein KHQ89_07880 [Mycoplasmatota bacterium]|nr:hypothetical protein KHQ89_07880 [Mycoplasmatota bacterium]
MFEKVFCWSILLLFSLFILLKKNNTKGLKWELRSHQDIKMLKTRTKLIKMMAIIGIIFSIYMIIVSI